MGVTSNRVKKAVVKKTGNKAPTKKKPMPPKAPETINPPKATGTGPVGQQKGGKKFKMVNGKIVEVK